MEFEPNSNKSKAEMPKKPEVLGVVKKKPKPDGLKKAVSFISENLEKNDVKGRIINDILLPMILDMVNTGLAGAFGIEPARSRRALDSVVSAARSSQYWNAGNTGNKKYIDTTARTIRTVYDFDNPVFPTEKDADDAKCYLEAILSQYPYVRVADVVEITRDADGNPCIPTSSDSDYGWYTLKDVYPVHMSDGSWMLRMPKPVPLN